MLREMIHEICGFSVISSLAYSLAPSVGGKNVLRMASAVVFILLILRPICGFDWDAYQFSLGRYHELEKQITQKSEELSKRLNRLVIEEEYRAYILDKARKLQIRAEDIRLELSWMGEGFWQPVSIRGKLWGDKEGVQKLISTLETELGLKREVQHWEINPSQIN